MGKTYNDYEILLPREHGEANLSDFDTYMNKFGF